MLYQERNLIPYLTGAQNILLREEPIKFGFLIDENEIVRKAEELKEIYDINVPLNFPVSQLSSAKKQAIEILRALLYKPNVLILDEPTSSLTEAESMALFTAIKRIKNEGVSVILITHKMEEVFRMQIQFLFSEMARKLHPEAKKDITRNECKKLMVNRNISSIYPPVTCVAHNVVMEVKGVSDSFLVKDNSFFFGRERSWILWSYRIGRTELIELIYGSEIENGCITINGVEVVPNIKKMIDNNVFLIPDDRREKGLILRYNLKKNLTVAFIDRISGLFGLINSKTERNIAEKIASNDSLKLKYVSINQEVDSLSGGNQQKVIISRWISKENIKVLILDEPTNGIDVEQSMKSTR